MLARENGAPRRSATFLTLKLEICALRIEEAHGFLHGHVQRHGDIQVFLDLEALDVAHRDHAIGLVDLGANRFLVLLFKRARHVEELVGGEVMQLLGEAEIHLILGRAHAAHFAGAPQILADVQRERLDRVDFARPAPIVFLDELRRLREELARAGEHAAEPALFRVLVPHIDDEDALALGVAENVGRTVFEIIAARACAV